MSISFIYDRLIPLILFPRISHTLLTITIWGAKANQANPPRFRVELSPTKLLLLTSLCGSCDCE